MAEPAGAARRHGISRTSPGSAGAGEPFYPGTGPRHPRGAAGEAPAQSLVAAAFETRSGLSLISLDLDGLKAVNDREGHHRGDALLVGFATALRLAFRGEDALFRVGGDEFVMLVKHADPGGAAVGGSLARVQVALEKFRSSGFDHANVSAGIATFPDDDDEAEELLRLSDQRMYLQKHEHRASLKT